MEPKVCYSHVLPQQCCNVEDALSAKSVTMAGVL